MEKKDYGVICMIIVLVLLCNLAIFAGIVSYQNTIKKDEVIIGEGIIEDMRIDPDKGLADSADYILTIKGKDYLVAKDSYYEVEIGDHVRVYESGRVEVKE